ncbi:MAG: hypothetical protein AB1758_03180 [Candidatus Eremiobacterota bacterium]
MDPVLVLAQALNFLLLVAILRRVLYQPILDLVDRREERYRVRESEAARWKAEAEAGLKECRAAAEALARERSELRQKLEAEAHILRGELEQRLRSEVEDERQRRLKALETELEGVQRATRDRLARTLLQACRRCLIDLADSRLEELVARRLLERWDAVALPPNGEVVVRSAFPLSGAQQSDFRQVVQASRFEVEPELGFGIEVESGGRVAGWNLSRYLESLEHELRRVMRDGEPA